MLATMNPPQDAHYPAHNSHRDSRPDYQAQLADSSGLEDRLCPGCKLSAVSEHGGLVVAFGCVLTSYRIAMAICRVFRGFANIRPSFGFILCVRCC